MLVPSPGTSILLRMIPRDASDLRFLVGVALLLSLFYLPLASYRLSYHPDPLTNVFTAWSLAQNHSPYLDDWESVTGPDFYGHANQVLESDGRPVSKYPPGASLLAAPLHLIYRDAPVVSARFVAQDNSWTTATSPVPSLVPGGIVAAITTAVGVAAVALLARRRIGHNEALISGVVVGLGTSFWSVSADALWQHGPVAMWVGLALVACDKARWWSAGALFGLAILTRPQIAIAAAILGVLLAWRTKSWRPLVGLGAGSTLGAAAYVGYNLLVFGHALPVAAGGYWVENVVESSLGFYFDNVWRTLFDLNRGIMVWSPMLWLSLPALTATWKRADELTRAAFVAGVLLMAVQLRGNTWTGGDAFFAYRYALEPLFLCLPMLIQSTYRWVLGEPLRLKILSLAAGASVLIHLIGAVTY